MGGFALCQVAAMVYGSKAPEWARLLGLAAFGAMGIVCFVLALKQQFGKKPAPPPPPKLKAKRTEFSPEDLAAIEAARKIGGFDGTRETPAARAAKSKSPNP